MATKSIEELFEEIEKALDDDGEGSEKPVEEPIKEEKMEDKVKETEKKEPAKESPSNVDKILAAIENIGQRVSNIELGNFLSTPAGALYSGMKDKVPDITPQVASQLFGIYNEMYAGGSGANGEKEKASKETERQLMRVSKAFEADPELMKKSMKLRSEVKPGQYMAIMPNGEMQIEDEVEVI